MLRVFFSFLLLLGCDSEPKKNKLVISAASSLRPALEEIKPLYESSLSLASSTQLVFNFGSSGSLSQQILNGAKVDLFLSASPEKVKPLIVTGLVSSNDFHILLRNELVLIAPQSNVDIKNLNDLTNEKIQRIALGDPKSVPAGQYAFETLVHQKMESAVKAKLVLTKDVSQVLTYVENGEVQAGFVYLSDARHSKKVKMVLQLDPTYHSPITYASALITGSSFQSQSLQFLSFLKTNWQAQQILTQRGFTYF